MGKLEFEPDGNHAFWYDVTGSQHSDPERERPMEEWITSTPKKESEPRSFRTKTQGQR